MQTKIDMKLPLNFNGLLLGLFRFEIVCCKLADLCSSNTDDAQQAPL